MDFGIAAVSSRGGLYHQTGKKLGYTSGPNVYSGNNSLSKAWMKDVELVEEKGQDLKLWVGRQRTVPRQILNH